MEVSDTLLAKSRPCLACQAARIQCDQLQPACGHCIKNEASCRYLDTPPAKRKHFTVVDRIPSGKACRACRQKKTKCDGEKPVCGKCQNRSDPCLYDNSPLSSSRPQSVSRNRTIQSPLQFNPVRLPSSFERERSAKKPRLSLPYIVSDYPSPVFKNGKPPRSSDGACQPRPESISETSEEEGEEETYVSADEGGNTTGDVQLFVSQLDTTAPEPRSITHSDRSVELRDAVDGDFDRRRADQPPFIIKLKQAIIQRSDVSKPGSSEYSSRELERLSAIRKNKPGIKTATPDRRDLTLPSREVADHLMALYLTREYVNLPIFLLSSLQAKYATAWSGEDLLDDLGVFRGILNVMFALGCLATNPDNQNDASMYFMRAQNLICLNSVKGDSLLHVQAHLIASQYLLAVNSLDAAWKSIGLAIRIAESLRLHLASGSHHLPQREDRELARRLWHSCMIMENIIAINQGSCTTKRTSRPPLPTPLENDYVDVIFGGEPISGIDRPSIIEFFTASVHLYEKYDDIAAIQNELRLTGNVTPRKKLMCFESQALFNIDNFLCDWQASLPPFLQPDAKHAVLKNPIARRQHNIIRIRYLYMRLLLWRPFLALVATSLDLSRRLSPTSNSQQMRRQLLDNPLCFAIAHESTIKCIVAAREIVDLLAKYQQLEPHSGPVPACWENTGYVYACANVFIAARRCPESIYKEIDGGANWIREGWRLSTGLLDSYRKFSRKAGQCLNALNAIDELITNGLAPLDQHGLVDMSWLESLPVDLEDVS